MGKRLILAINPGSTSTKFSLFEEDSLIFEKSLRHTPAELAPFSKVPDQYNFRKGLIMNELKERNIDTWAICAVVGRGGLVKPIESGVYEVNELMKDHLARELFGSHACNLGALIADDIASTLPSAKAYIVDPVVVDELQPVARLSGHPAIERRSVFHALNQKAVARIHARETGRVYEELNLIIVHMGGGVSVGAHRKGKVVDVNNALNGDGPFTPERSGGLPAGQLAGLCFSGRYTMQEILDMITGKGGMLAYLGTNDYLEVTGRAEAGDKEAKLVVDAFIYQICKEIGAMSAVLEGKVDFVILTGGIARHAATTKEIASRTAYIAEVVVYPGEDEMEALAFNGLLALDGRIEIRKYT